MLPSRLEAEKILSEAEKLNPGLWGNHSRVAAYCAEKIADCCSKLNSDKAYILGLLHDIGRRFGVTHLKHVLDGYSYMTELGYDEVARVCLTHSFNNKQINEYIGKFDVTEDELAFIESTIAKINYDEYDRLIQLCDALAGASCVLDIEDRMADVRNRYGFYPKEKWDSNVKLKEHFEKLMGIDIYIAVDKEHFQL